MTQGFRVAAGLAASALLFAVYAAFDAAWLLGFVALVPWLLVLRRATTWRAALLQGIAMAVLFTAAVFWWFGLAIGAYVDVHAAIALLVLLVAAPLLQPQIIVFALAHQLAGRRFGAVVQAAAAVSAWVATEALCPKLLGDTLGHGLHDVDALRASAAFGGAAGLTAMLLLVNSAVALMIARVAEAVRIEGRRRTFFDWRAWALPLGLAAGLVSATSAYGLLRLDALRTAADVEAPLLRVAMVQASLVDYERRRREQGSFAVVREVLDTHFALSYSAVRDHGADALLWSETVYPTTFGQPKSADGAEIQGFVDAMGTPLLFGTYERDALGEYNAAVLLEPGRGRLASYRKTHPFPLTERVPAWLDGPTLRRLLPWTGTWRAGDGARVLPLRSRDGREVQVLPLICLDDVHAQLAVDGARLGAQAIVGMSNDAWFTRYPRGARLHLAVAAFRSAETGLPQLRVTTNGMSAVIDESGEVLVRTQMGQQAALTGHLVARDPLPTPMVRFGDWVGRAGFAFLAALALWSLLAWRAGRVASASAEAQAKAQAAALMPPPARIAIAVLRLAAGVGLVWLAYDMATRIGWQVQSLDQLRSYALFVLLPLIAAAALRWRQRTTLAIENGALLIDRPRERIEIPLAAIARVEPWRLPLPAAGVDVVLGSGRRWSLAGRIPSALRDKINTPSRLASLAEQRASVRHPRFDHPLLKFGLFPLLPAIVAFQLHQRITFGGPFGEWQAFGLDAWLGGFAIWWGAWSLGLMLLAATLRIAIETICAGVTLASTRHSAVVRDAAEWLGRLAFYAGVPIWLGIRLLSG